jgi:peroxiredoxin Q/BCP
VKAPATVAKLEIGQGAPEFDLAGSGGSRHRLVDYRGRWVILAFYPGDFTPVCTRQFCSYRDAADRLDDLDAVVLGISPQSVSSHDRFIEEHDLTVPLLADPDHATARAYSVVAPGGLVRRSIFILDPEGIVRYRHVALLGLRYKDVEHLARALARARGDR